MDSPGYWMLRNKVIPWDPQSQGFGEKVLEEGAGSKCIRMMWMHPNAKAPQMQGSGPHPNPLDLIEGVHFPRNAKPRWIPGEEKHPDFPCSLHCELPGLGTIAAHRPAGAGEPHKSCGSAEL